VASAGAVGVPGLDHEPGRAQDRSLGIHGEIGRPALQVARHQELDIILAHPPVRVEVLARRVGVDRHLSRLPSADRGDEIESDHPALLAGEIERCVRDLNLHPAQNRADPTQRGRSQQMPDLGIQRPTHDEDPDQIRHQGNGEGAATFDPKGLARRRNQERRHPHHPDEHGEEERRA